MNNNYINPSSTPQKRQEPKLPPSGIPFGYLPAFLPGSASLVEQLDRKILIVLRDGRHLVGILRSFDQFSNMVLEDTSERRILHLNQGGETICYFVDIQLGIYLVRGDSTVLFGEIDTEREDSESPHGHASQGSAVEGYGLVGGFVDKTEYEKYMKEVTLEEFEKLQEENKEDVIQSLTWDFDMDLVV